MKLVVCDDRESDRKAVLRQIKSSAWFSADMELLELASGEALIRWYEKGNRADLLFLDIEMPGEDGLRTARKIRERDGAVILVFVSCHSERALDTFDYETFHFLVKPYSQERFDAVFGKAVKKYHDRNACFLVTWKNETARVPIASIKYVERLHKHILFYTDDERYEMVTTLSETLAKLAPYGFVQTHQGYLVNMAWIRRFDGQDAVLRDGTRVMISVRRRAQVLEQYAKYAARGR